MIFFFGDGKEELVGYVCALCSLCSKCAFLWNLGEGRFI